MNPSSEEAPTIRLDQFLKLNNAVGSGGEAKMLIQSGEVQVNGVVDTRRGRKLRAGDRVELAGESWTVSF